MAYEPRDDVYRGAYLPHREEGGVPQMITIRLNDSLPREIMADKLALATSSEERRLICQRYLDKGRGRCILRRDEIGEMVGEAIKFYDGRHYSLIDWVVMPNHIHFNYQTPKSRMGKIVGNIKSYTTKQMNEILGEGGNKWQRDFHDRFARDEGHLFNMTRYILLNPVHAGLVDDPFDWPYSSIHDYSPAFKDELRRWYRSWKERFWRSVGDDGVLKSEKRK